jgi:ribosome-binding factor A
MPSHSQKGRPGKGGRGRPEPAGPTQRQLKAGELVRHALAEILREEPLHDPALLNASITVTEARVSPDLRHATVFVEPLGGRDAATIVEGLNRVSRYIRGVLGRTIELKFTPDLRFVHDQSFDAALAMNRLFDNPVVQRDLAAPDDEETGAEDGDH